MGRLSVHVCFVVPLELKQRLRGAVVRLQIVGVKKKQGTYFYRAETTIRWVSKILVTR